MTISRREFLNISAKALAISSALSTQAFGSVAEALGSLFTGDIPICQHMTNATTSQFTVLTLGKMPYAYRVLDSQGRDVPVQLWDHATRKGFDCGIDKLFVQNLRSEERYRLRVIDKDRGTILDERIFKALPLTTKKSLRFALVSCMDDMYFYQRKNMWSRLFAHRPEMIFAIGDTVYADTFSDGTADGLWKRYCETRSLLHHFRQPFLIPTLATWDDHDYGKNNANKNFHLKEAARRIFDLFWGSREVDGFKRGYGVSSIFTGFGQRFFFMDDRYFRDDPGLSRGLHWGRDQQEDFLARLGENSKPSWILNGSQYFGNYYKQESMLKDYTANLKDVLKKLSQISAPVILGSGDIHFSEILELEPRILGYKTFEITSSSIHSFAIPLGEIMRNDRRVEYSWHHNYLIINSSVVDGGLKTLTQSYGRFGQNLFTHQGRVIR
ncbi:alkaline phosphatase D family protein [Bdellovibrio svalbardensis]|uniref:Phosphodiesterase n=1 Tax=Bdellovibrio svalbardensis TaxID=2972972 RepID=A0ABT6DSL1_9BACT|nr:phosphodiesterase [Bdellovibrio svalbardensis]MDG0818133.1 phosphodiesterase [Bdellovibrio svalbardensis]